MSALGKALSAMINGEKPRSSISDWIDILSSPRYNEDDYEGIPELVDSINLQSTGPTEASRAIRKKLKYGDVHRQLRALTILKALVENCGTKFQTSFANDRLTERIKAMVSDPMTDEHVKRKLMSVLASWHRQFKDDPKMSLIAGLYHTCGGGGKKAIRTSATPSSPSAAEIQQKKARHRAQEREESRLKEFREKEAKRRERKEGVVVKTKGKPFDFGQEKPQVISSISTASQASNNLVNALKLVNRERESIETNVRVQECLAQAKAARKEVVRYIQLVEDEEFIGTLIDSNERVITALALYDRMLKNADQDSDDSDLAGKMDRLTTSESEIFKLQETQRVAVQRAVERSDSMENLFNGTPGRGVNLHPDLHDLTFGELGASRSGLPPPITPDAISGDHDQDSYHRRGSLSDYSDYVSDEERHATVTPSGPSNQSRVGFPEISRDSPGGKEPLIDLNDDPFADPTEVSTSTGIPPMKQYVF